MSEQSKNYRVSKATGAIVATLKVIATDDAGSLWEAIQEKGSVDKALGIEHLADKKYLEALAEAYQNATSWETRRQVLSIFADLLPFSEIQKYIPGVTKYRVRVAKLHIQRQGRGSAVPVQKSPRMKIDENQLDHLLSFITSPHTGPPIW